MEKDLPLFSEDDIKNLKNAFDAFDDNCDNLISTDVLPKVLRAVGLNPLPSEIEDMKEDIGELTLDFNGFIYIVYRHAREADPAQELLDSFRVFDKDGKGTLDVNTIHQILSNLKQPYSEEQINELIVLAKPYTKNDQIDYKNFVNTILEY